VPKGLAALPRNALLLCGLLIVISVSACNEESVTTGELAGTSWRLAAWSVTAMDAGDFDITAQFDNTRISGKVIVNTYDGPCTVGNGEFLVQSLSVTEIAGTEDEMQAEQYYIELLMQTRSYGRTDSTLSFSNADRKQLLLFRKR
jgi:heat shock protein HslJ